MRPEGGTRTAPWVRPLRSRVVRVAGGGLVGCVLFASGSSVPANGQDEATSIPVSAATITQQVHLVGPATGTGSGVAASAAFASSTVSSSGGPEVRALRDDRGARSLAIVRWIEGLVDLVQRQVRGATSGNSISGTGIAQPGPALGSASSSHILATAGNSQHPVVASVPEVAAVGSTPPPVWSPPGPSSTSDQASRRSVTAPSPAPTPASPTPPARASADLHVGAGDPAVAVRTGQNGPTIGVPGSPAGATEAGGARSVTSATSRSTVEGTSAGTTVVEQHSERVARSSDGGPQVAAPDGES